MSDECLCQKMTSSSGEIAAICQSVCWAHAHSQLTVAVSKTEECSCHPGEMFVDGSNTQEDVILDDVSSISGSCKSLTSLCDKEERINDATEVGRICSLTQQVDVKLWIGNRISRCTDLFFIQDGQVWTGLE